ncbi:MAG: serine/threonine-protein kinase, partial [Myxococcales bacterium]|nr:serine/threonine-protein kinase [Myxococcales bacterium]
MTEASAAAPAPELLAGKYRLVRLIGEGGMGSVWEAMHEVTGKRLAIKRMSAQLLGHGEAVERFVREARAASAITHPNVVEIFDVGVHEGAPFMVMELLQGESLADVLRRGVLDAISAVEVLTPVMLALAMAHERGIVHRDMKPDNIYLARRGNRVVPKLLDFGISKSLGQSQDHRLTRTGSVLGTPYYMAPEQAAGRRDIDHRVDVYALGAILYEALTGRVPFDADNYNALLIAILTKDVTPVSAFRPDLPPAISDVVARAMSRDVSLR